MKLSDLHENPRNPRAITPESLKGLEKSIEEFGDLSGITFNRTTSQLVCGHQRVKALKAQYGDLELTDDGIQLPNGNFFPVRFVEWSEEFELAANVAANSTTVQGTWTAELEAVLSDIEADMPGIYEDLKLESLKVDIPSINEPRDLEPGDGGGEGDTQEWIEFSCGEIVGGIPAEVYEMFLEEWRRVERMIETDKTAPVLETIISNSAETPSRND